MSELPEKMGNRWAWCYLIGAGMSLGYSDCILWKLCAYVRIS